MHLPHISLHALDEQVLAGLNFSRVHVSVILIEPDCHKSRRSCAALRAAGYTQVRDTNVVDSVWTRAPLLGPQGQTSAIQSYKCDRQSSCRGWDYDGHGADYAGAPGVRWVSSI